MKKAPRTKSVKIEWLNDKRQPHRIGGAAIIAESGARYWLVNGRLHRDGGPAVEYSDGRTEFWRNGVPRDPTRRSAPNPFAWIGYLLCGMLKGTIECIFQIW